MRDNLIERVLRGAAGTAGLQVANRVAALLLSIILARVLGAEGYGIYAYLWATLTVVMVVAEFGVPILLLRELSSCLALNKLAQMRGSLVWGLATVTCASILLSVMGMAAIEYWSLSLSIAERTTAVTAITALPVLALCKTLAHAIRGLGHVLISQALTMVFQPWLVLASFTIVYAVAGEMLGPAHAMGVQSGVGVVVLILGGALLRYVWPAQRVVTRKEVSAGNWLTSAGWFMGLAAAGVVNTHADLIMLRWFVPVEQIGAYRVAVQGAALVGFGLQTINIVIAPHLAALWARGDKSGLQRLATKTARVAIIFGIPVASTLVLAGGVIIEWVFGDDYRSGHIPLALLSIAHLLNASFGSVGYLMNMTGNESVSGKVLAGTAIANIILNYTLIPPFGMIGAAVATSLSMIAWNIVLLYQVQARLGIWPAAYRFS